MLCEYREGKEGEGKATQSKGRQAKAMERLELV